MHVVNSQVVQVQYVDPLKCVPMSGPGQPPVLAYDYSTAVVCLCCLAMPLPVHKTVIIMKIQNLVRQHLYTDSDLRNGVKHTNTGSFTDFPLTAEKRESKR